MATLNVPVGGFRLSDLFEAMTGTDLVSSTATKITFRFPGSAGGLDVFGTGITPNGQNGIASGVITGIDYIGVEGTVLWSMRGLTGLDIASTAFQNAASALESGNTAPMMQILAGNTWSSTGSFTSDELIGGAGKDTLRGGLGNDVFVGSQGNDVINGGPHAGALFDDTSVTDYDAIDYGREKGAQAIKVDLNLAANQIKDTHGAYDTVSGIELIIGTSRADTMNGSGTSRYEAFTGGNGADVIDGRAGLADEVRYDREGGTQGVIVDLDATSATQGTGRDTFGSIDVLKNVERVRGSQFDDEIRGNAADNRFIGLQGKDTMDGGEGSDWVRYDLDASAAAAAGTQSEGVRVNLSVGFARDGFKNVDSLISIENVRGTDLYDRLIGSAVNNILEGEGGADYLAGGGGNDTLSGGNGGDLLIGGLGNDVLKGDNGSDILVGGIGNDTLTGGVGFDVFAFAGAVTLANLGADRITDFEDGKDVIDLSGLTGAVDPVTGLASLAITDAAGGVSISFVSAPAVSILVQGSGLTAASFTAVDFLF